MSLEDRRSIDLPLILTNLVDSLNSYLGKGVIEIYGSCSAVFDGRIKSTLDSGDRLLIIKMDKTILLHGLLSLKPINWQLPGVGEIEFTLKNSDIEMYTYRVKTKESFSIVFDQIYSARILFGIPKSESLQIEGNEADLQTYLVKNPNVIEEGFLIIDREFVTPIGKIDLIGKDSSGKMVLIELKKGIITPADTFQIVRYLDTMKKVWNSQEKVRAILIGSKISNKLLFYLKEHSIEFKEFQWQEIFPAVPRLKKKDLSEFFT